MGKKANNLIGIGLEPFKAAVVEADTVTSSNTLSVSTGLTAAGTIITDALDLVSLVNIVTTTAASTGVQLPDVDIGVEVIVQNNGANALNIWPHSSSGTLNGGSGGAAVTCAAAAGNRCIRVSSTDWLVSVYAKES